jgi:uncharacterized membrane protein YkgB
MKQLISKTLTIFGHFLLRYGLALVLVWLGIMKFSSGEVMHVERALSQVNWLGWLLHYFTAHALSHLFAWLLIVTGVLVALRPVSRKLSLWGGSLAFFIFLFGVIMLGTSGFLLVAGSGFPELSSSGQGLLKDIVLLGAAAWCTADSM